MARTPGITAYSGLITSEHRKPKFTAMVEAVAQPFAGGAEVLDHLPVDFDLDTAIGAQLDVVGEWVGRSRYINTPVPNAWFSLDSARRGFDLGVWFQPYDSEQGIVRLDDTTYRIVLRAKIAANHWDGTVEGARAALDPVFSGTGSLLVLDARQDMSAIYGLAGAYPAPLYVALLSAGYLSLKPAGVDVKYFITSSPDAPLFGFDVQNEFVSGFDTGALGISPSDYING